MENIYTHNASVVSFFAVSSAVGMPSSELFMYLFPTKIYDNYEYGNYILVSDIQDKRRDNEMWDEVIYILEEMGTNPILNDIIFLF